MMIGRRGLLLSVLGFFCSAALAQVVENAELRLEVSPQTGSIIHLFDKRNQTEYISDPKTVRLFELLIPNSTNYSRRIVSWNQTAHVETKGDQIEIHYEDLQPDQDQYRFGAGMVHVPEPRLPIAVEITLQLQGDHISARMHIQNKSLLLLTGVVFPYVGGMPAKSGNESAKFLLPSLGQRIFPHTFGVLSGQKAIRYPGVLASSWVSYELGSKGLGIEAKSGLDAQDAYFSMSPGPLQEGSAYRGRYEFPFIAWIQYPHIGGQTEWTSPEMTIHVHNSDWHTIAAEHREWFRATNKPEPNKTWNQSAGFATFFLKRDDNTIDWKYRDLPRLVAETETAGIHNIVIEGWRKQEGLSNPAPYGEIVDPRLGGDAVLKQVIADLRKKGVNLLFAYHSALMNVRQDHYPPEHAFWAVKTRRDATQIPVDYTFETVDYPLGIAGYHYWIEIDPTSAATDYLLTEARRLKQDYGFQNLFLKGIGQRAFLSYNRYQGVAPQDVYATGYKKFLGGLREIYSDGLLLNEGFNDLVNPFGNGAYTWDQTHDSEVLPYSLPWSSFSNDVEALDYEAANTSFAHKALMNLIVDAGANSVAHYPEFAQHLSNLQKLKAATLPYYADAEFRDHDGLKNVTDAPGTVVAVFANQTSQKTGIVVGNLTEQNVSAGFELQSPMNMGSARVFPEGSGMEEIDLAKPISLQLRPHQIIILAIDASLSHPHR
jgi:hypothetical protein